MGVSSNLEVFLPKKHHPKDHLHLVRPAMETNIPTREEQRVQEEDDDDQEKQLNNNVDTLPMLSLKIKVEGKKDDLVSDDGMKTPTSQEHRIPAILPYPPAPRKPKPQPSTKRKGCCCRPQIVLDLSQEIESFFSSQFNVNPNAGAENKKIKLSTN